MPAKNQTNWTGIIWVGVIGVAMLAAIFGNNERSSSTIPTPVEPMVKETMEQLQSTPAGRSEVQRIGSKDNDLTRFQKHHDISDDVAEAAIKEWVLTHNGQFDWNLEEVKTICLRNKRSGIPHQYLPESKK